MGFVNVESYGGNYGYIHSDDAFSWDVVEIEGVKYLVNIDNAENPPHIAYRIVREGADTAIATTVKDKKLIERLKEKYLADLEANEYLGGLEAEDSALDLGLEARLNK